MIINNASLVTFWPSQPFVDGALIATEGKSIVDFGKMGKLIDRYDDPETLDAAGRLVLPGMIDTHALLWRSLATSRGGTSSLDTEEESWARVEGVLDAESNYWSAVVALMDAVKAGITTVLAFHSSPEEIAGSHESLARAFGEVGVRGSIAYAVSSRSDVPLAIEENVRHLCECEAGPSEMLRGLFGLQVSEDMDDSVLRRCLDAAEQIGARFHLSLARTREALDESLSRWGATPTGRLRQLGLSTRAGFSAHTPHRLPADEALLRDTDMWLLDCPQSEALAGSPSPELAQLRGAGGRVAVGTDGLGVSLLEEYRLMVLQQCAKGLDIGSSVRLASWACFAGNAGLATELFGPPLGCLRPGARADLVVLDHVPSTPLAENNLPEQLFWGASSARVRTVIVNGRILYQNGEFVTLDESRLRARAREVAAELWERI